MWADPGAGKTSIVYKAFTVLQANTPEQRMVVFAPFRPAAGTWPVEHKLWKQFAHLRVVFLHGPKKNKDVMQDADVYVMTPDAVGWFTTPIPGHPRRWSPQRVINASVLVIDESSKWKNTQSERFKKLKGHLDRYDYRWPLTGSPAPKGYIDVFGQVYLADQGKSLGTRITKFREDYFLPTGFGGFDYKLQPDGIKRIHKAIAPAVYRVESEQYLDLPEFVPHPIWVDLPPEARRIYGDLERDLFSLIDSKNKVIAVNAAVMTGKCEQVANGGIWLGEGDERAAKHIHNAKTEALEELCSELNGKQMAIAYHYEHDLERIRGLLGKRMPFIGGGVSWKRALEIQDEWNAGNLQYLPLQPQSAGHGLNLQKSNPEHVCYYHLPWNYDDYDQLRKRFRRQGNKAKHVWEHWILTRDTVDMAKMLMRQQRGDTQTSLLTAMAEYRKSKRK